MPTQVQFRRGTTTQNNAFTGAAGELSVDSTLNTLRLHDGSTAGGVTLVTLNGTQTLTNKTLTSPTLNSATANNLTLTGTLTAGGGVGTNGQFLASTGSGVQWTTPSFATTGKAIAMAMVFGG
jgi:hypothetical protein